MCVVGQGWRDLPEWWLRTLQQRSLRHSCCIPKAAHQAKTPFACPGLPLQQILTQHLCVCPPYLFTSKTTANLVFLFISFLLLSIQTVWFHKMYFTWGSPACTLLPILSKSKESIKDLNEDIHLNSSMLSSKIGSGLKTEQTNKQTNERTNKQANKQTNTWTPMRNHEHP